MSIANTYENKDDHKIPQQVLWLEVIARALTDAHYKGTNRVDLVESRRADTWLRTMSDDFQTVCALAGIGPHFLRDAYVSGRINMVGFKASERLRLSAIRDAERLRAMKMAAAE